VLPPDTRLLRGFADPTGTVWLDFNRALRGSFRPGDGEEWLAIASVVRSLCDNFPEVGGVRFLVEGEALSTLGGYLDLDRPLGAADFPLDDEI
jgi:hypothetical protein